MDRSKILNCNTEIYPQGCYASLRFHSYYDIDIVVFNIADKTGRPKYIIPKTTMSLSMKHWFLCENYIVFADNMGTYNVYDINTGIFIHDILKGYYSSSIKTFIQIFDKNGNNKCGRFLSCTSDGILRICNASNKNIELKYFCHTDITYINGIPLKFFKILIMPPINNEIYGKIMYATNLYVYTVDIDTFYKNGIIIEKSYNMCHSNAEYNVRKIQNMEIISERYIIILYSLINTDFVNVTNPGQNIIAILDILTGNKCFMVNLYKPKTINSIDPLIDDLFIIRQEKTIDIWRIIHSELQLNMVCIKTVSYDDFILSTQFLAEYLIVNLCKYSNDNEPYDMSFHIYN
jgi:hypothetical protein